VVPTGLSDPLVLGFLLLPIALAALFVWAVSAAWRRSGAPPQVTRRAASTVSLGAAVWLGALDMAARSGLLRQWDWRPPPAAILVAALLTLSLAVAFSDVGRRLGQHLPLWALVGVHAFRWPLELMMHDAYERGVMPVQMSYSGQNFDIVTGMSAAIVAPLVAAGLGHRWFVAAWNVLGFALLLNVMVVAVLSTPMVAYFGDERLNVWVTYPPFVWLPGVMVPVALMGHLIIFRRLARGTRV
jgi:hypothetical protein